VGQKIQDNIPGLMRGEGVVTKLLYSPGCLFLGKTSFNIGLAVFYNFFNRPFLPIREGGVSIFHNKNFNRKQQGKAFLGMKNLNRIKALTAH
jgi:hypothetical protein